MFFGLTNSPATFQMMMNTIFRTEVAQGWLSVYMDDIAIHTKCEDSETEQQHVERHRAAGQVKNTGTDRGTSTRLMNERAERPGHSAFNARRSTRRRAARSHPGKSSLFAEAPHAFLVVSDPLIHLLAAELPWRREICRARAAETRGKEQEQFLLLLLGQGIGGGFDLGERAHEFDAAAACHPLQLRKQTAWEKMRFKAGPDLGVSCSERDACGGLNVKRQTLQSACFGNSRNAMHMKRQRFRRLCERPQPPSSARRRGFDVESLTLDVGRLARRRRGVWRSNPSVFNHAHDAQLPALISTSAIPSQLPESPTP